MHAHRGNKVCTSSLLVPQPVLETQLLAGLEASVFSPAVVSYTLQEFEQQLRREIEKCTGETCAFEEQIADLERKIRNCTAAIAEGRAFKSVLEQLGSLEAELQETKARAESAKPGALRVLMQDIGRFVESKLHDLQKRLNADPKMARAEDLCRGRRLESLGCGLLRWCRGPESNWLRPPFQGGALPMSYPGNSTLVV
jgi:hypothetical protein